MIRLFCIIIVSDNFSFTYKHHDFNFQDKSFTCRVAKNVIELEVSRITNLIDFFGLFDSGRLIILLAINSSRIIGRLNRKMGRSFPLTP